jgi:hypothetical protein
MLARACGIVLVASAGLAAAQPVIDGTIAGDNYGDAVSVQKVQTGFGDNFSELNAAYARIADGKLFLALTGNLEANFNKLELFIDSAAGGENTLTGNPGNDNAQNMTGLTFDRGFDADYHLILRRGFDGNTNRFDLDFAQIGTPNFSVYGDIFGGSSEGSGMTGTGVNAFPISVAYDNSNVAGIAGGDQAADQNAALAVETGFELAIDLADLGAPAGAFKVLAFINNQDHNYASNQFLGSLEPPHGNLGGDGSGGFTGVFNVDLNNFAGQQYFIVPAPATAAALAMGALLGARRRR